jgi:DNA-binding transcriptional LysR family regulator
MLGELSRAQQEVDALRGGATGVLRLGTLSVTVSVPRAITHLRRRMPGARVQVVEGRVRDMVQLLLEGELDAVFGAITPELLASELLHQLRPEVLLADELCILCAEGHPLARRRQLAWADLQAGRLDRTAEGHAGAPGAHDGVPQRRPEPHPSRRSK